MGINDQDRDQVVSIHKAIQDTGSGVLIRWFVVADWMDGSGQRSLTMTSTPDSTVWEDRGLLQAALDFWGVGD